MRSGAWINEEPPYLVLAKDPESAVTLEEVLDRIELLPLKDVPDGKAVERSRSSDEVDGASIKRWLISRPGKKQVFGPNLISLATGGPGAVPSDESLVVTAVCKESG